VHELLEDALPFLVAFFVVESLAFVGPAEWLFVSLAGRFHSAREGIHLAALTPTARVYSTYRPALRWTEEGVRVLDRDLVSVPYAALDRIEVDRHRVVLSPTVVLATPSNLDASILRDRLATLRDAPASGRLALFSRLCADAHDLTALRGRLAAFEQRARPLWRLQTALSLAAFGLIPLEVYGGSVIAVSPLVVLALLVPMYATTLVLGYRLAGATGQASGKRAGTLLGFVLFPPSCLHLSGLVGRPLLAGFAPLAAAAALLPRPEFERFARQCLRRLELEHDGSGFADVELESARRLVLDAGFRLEQVLGPPVVLDATTASYCPLCSEEYRAGFAACVDCHTALEPVAGRPAS
jgi:hypothetical protein